MITKDSIETAYSFLHQKRNVYIHSTLDWQKDDIELAIGSYVDDMSQELYEAISDGRADFDIQFPQFDKIEVNGNNAHPLYTWLKAGNDIKWNFTKFLVSRYGKVLKRYEPRDKISDIEADIQLEVNPVLSSIMARRSIRKYLDKPVEHEKLEVVVRAGINAPSGMNRQPWIVRVVENQKLIADVTEVYKQENAEQVKYIK